MNEFKIGDLFVNLQPEMDSDHHDNERTTPPGSVWRVTEVTPDYVSIVCDTTGGWINPTTDELRDPTQYVRLLGVQSFFPVPYKEPEEYDPIERIDKDDIPTWRRVDAFIERQCIDGKDLDPDFTSLEWEEDGFHVPVMASIFVPLSVYTKRAELTAQAGPRPEPVPESAAECEFGDQEYPWRLIRRRVRVRRPGVPVAAEAGGAVTTKIKCAWCGKEMPPTKSGQRPKQHQDGPRICVGSGQLILTHNMLREAAKRNQRKD